jgi:hypothetical protein
MSPELIREVCKVINPIICDVPIPDADLQGILDQAEEFARKVSEDRKTSAISNTEFHRIINFTST